MAGRNTEDQAEGRTAAGVPPQAQQERFTGRVGNVQGSTVVLGHNNTVTYLQLTMQPGEHGAVIVVPDHEITISRRPGPVQMRQPPPDILDRDRERMACASTAPTVVEIFGETGIGKSVILAALSNDLPLAQPDSFSDGVIYSIAQEVDFEDLLFDLWSFFYQANVPWNVVPARAQQRLQLQDVSALILLDDAQLSENEIKSLNIALPRSSLILATDSQRLTGFGTSIPLFGLPQQYLQDLADIQLRRLTFVGPAIPASVLNDYWTQHRGNPLLIVRDISSWAMKASQSILPGLLSQSAPEVREAVQALGKPASAHMLEAILENPESGSIAEDHVKAAHFKANSPLYTYPLPQEKISPELVERVRSRAFVYLAQQPGPLAAADCPLALRLLRWATAHPGLSSAGMAVARTLGDAFMLNGYLGRWSETMRAARRIADNAQDAATVAWAMHNLGAAALCRGDNAEAQRFLQEALTIRLDNKADAAAVDATVLLLRAARRGGSGSGAAPSFDPLEPLVGGGAHKPSYAHGIYDMGTNVYYGEPAPQSR